MYSELRAQVARVLYIVSERSDQGVVIRKMLHAGWKILQLIDPLNERSDFLHGRKA